jgi:hypothetical protein
MPFPLRSIEQIYSDIATAGNEAGFVVVPEFKLHYDLAGQRHTKEVDFAWLLTRDNPAHRDDLPPYQVVAAFELEGFDVPLTTIGLHSEVYPLVRELLESEFPCYVPIYSLATHRPDYGHNVESVQQCILQRQNRAAQLHNVVEVCDGAKRDWLARANGAAGAVAHTWLQRKPMERPNIWTSSLPSAG